MSHQPNYFHDVQLACYHIARKVFDLFQNHIQMASESPEHATENDLQDSVGDIKRDLDAMKISNDQTRVTEGEGDDDDDKLPPFDWNHRGPLISNVKGSPKNKAAAMKAGSVDSSSNAVKSSQTKQSSSSNEAVSTATENKDEPTTSESEAVVEIEPKVEDKGKERQAAGEGEEIDEDKVPEFEWNFRGKMGSNVQGNTKAKAAVEAQREKERLKAAKAQDPKASTDPKKANKK